MKEVLSGIIVFVSVIFAYSQSEFNVWNESLVQCAKIKSGSYQMEYGSKYMMSQDTVFKRSNCTFKSNPSDTVFGFYFDAQRTIGAFSDFYSYQDGCFISGSQKKATLFQSKDAFNEVMSLRHNYDFFTPLTCFQKTEMAEIETNLLEFVGKEKIGSYTTWHYRYSPVEDPGQEVQVLRAELNFWINEADFIPVRYSIYYQVNLAGDTLDQYDEYRLSAYSLNNRNTHTFKTPDQLVKAGFHINEFTSNTSDSVQKLAIGSKVPGWRFETNKHNELSSDDQVYKLTLFDFYYQSCYPCLKTIPFLNHLSKTYQLNGTGLLVVGINNTDPVDDRFYEFIRKKEIQYPVALSSNQLNREFGVTAYPTLFLMDRQGELIYFSEGYSEQSEAELEAIIGRELKK